MTSINRYQFPKQLTTDAVIPDYQGTNILNLEGKLILNVRKNQENRKILSGNSGLRIKPKLQAAG
jgi:hypothetical protein